MSHILSEYNFNSYAEFVGHWKKFYQYRDQQKYDRNIDKVLKIGLFSKKVNEHAIRQLFNWKGIYRETTSGQEPGIAQKIEWLKKCVRDGMKIEDIIILARNEYLGRIDGGEIFNIFFLHCIAPKICPIYDQHTYRAMMFDQYGPPPVDKENKSQKYENYVIHYEPYFFDVFEVCKRRHTQRDVDKALFAFGKSLKTNR